MLEKVEFKNFKILRNATLPLGPFTLIVGANASGKSTALQGIELAAECKDTNIGSFGHTVHDPAPINPLDYRNVGSPSEPFHVLLKWADGAQAKFNGQSLEFGNVSQSNPNLVRIWESLRTFRKFSFEPRLIAGPVGFAQQHHMNVNGGSLVGVIHNLQNNFPDRFRELQEAMSSWIPDYDLIAFDNPKYGLIGLKLKAKGKASFIKAEHLSEGTLVALALLTLAYLPDPPAIVTIEEPDRGIHPRLLRLLQDALYRLSYPKEHGDDRPPVQVIATTHSPYFLDLFKEHPEEIVIAEKNGLEADFIRLSDKPDIQEILQDSSLGSAWYTGILGGVPAGT